MADIHTTRDRRYAQRRPVLQLWDQWKFKGRRQSMKSGRALKLCAQRPNMQQVNKPESRGHPLMLMI